jgi:hypothetical protein
MFPAANQGRNILTAAFDTSFVIPPIVQKADAAKPETARKRAGMYRLIEDSLPRGNELNSLKPFY